MKSIAILHYASPPTIGGVEATIFYHAQGLTELGYRVKLVSGKGEAFDNRIETQVNPLFGSVHPEILRVKHELDKGQVSAAFEDLVEQLVGALTDCLSDCDVCIVHNVPTLNKNLPLTAALAQFKQRHPIRLIAWCHDMAWTNEQYLPELHEGYPWDLLRQRWKDVIYVTVSEPRRLELAALLDMSPQDVTVVVPGVDPAQFFHWTPMMIRLVKHLGWLDADGILLLPARLTRRKNISLALHVLAAIRQQSKRDFRLIVTGPPGPHNPANPGYLGELLTLHQELALEKSAHFLYAFGEDETPLIPDNDTMANLYQFADGLFFPSLQEGFGIPVLEAGLAGLPVFCSDIPPFRKTGGDDVTYFDPVNDDAGQIADQILNVLEASPTYHLRGRVRRSYRWESIIRDYIVPLLC